MKKISKKLVRYDQEADVLGIYVASGKEDYSEEIAPNVSVEFNEKGRVIGFEILNASKVMGAALKDIAAKAPIHARA